MPIPFRLEWAIERAMIARNEPSEVDFGALREYGVGAGEAEVEWRAVLDHKWYLGERLGRDVGVHVAMMDYFENIRPARGLVHHAALRRVRSRLHAFADDPVATLERIYIDFFDAMRGARSISF